jgi:wyosine [tRNA(Phe)-imidazoG37] synthetase (radical SAM superfamily)
VNLVPHKICSLDCLYCEVGQSVKTTIKLGQYISAAEILREFNEIFPALKAQIDVITLTGAGEPTLNSDLPAIIKGIKAITDTPIAILTNSTTLTDPAVAEALLLCDIVVPSLDAATQATFEAVDRPAKGLLISEIINAIATFSHKFTGKLYLELLLVKGVNDSIDDLKAFAEAAKQIKYTTVQLGTVFRPPAWEGTARLTDDELSCAYKILMEEGVIVEPVGKFAKQNNTATPTQQLKDMLKMRPVTLADIVAATAIPEEQVRTLLTELHASEQIHDGAIYYTVTNV